MLATISGYAFNWQTGADNLMLVSIGNGRSGDAPVSEEAPRMMAAKLAIKSLMSALLDCSELHQALLQWMSRCPTPWTIDDEIGNLKGDQLGGQPLLHYLRYDVKLEPAWLATLGLTYPPAKLAHIRQFDRPDLADDWLALGRLAADRQVGKDHLPKSFDAVAPPHADDSAPAER
jgi:hypothetical protein